MSSVRKISLKKLEALLEETEYTVRYAKGTFKSGYCILKDQKQIVINAFAPKDAREGLLAGIIQRLDLDGARLSSGALDTLKALKQDG